MTKVGDRVGAVRRADKETVELIGWGTYQGEVDSPIGFPNPQILLDDGGVVWGFECWWGSEEKVKEMIGDRKVKIVGIDVAR